MSIRGQIEEAISRPVRTMALICVAATSIFFGYLAYRLIDILGSPDWCGRALQAERITAGNTFVGLTACVDLLKMQLGALARTLLIVVGTFALCLGVLVVIVLAGARLAGKIADIVDVNVSKDAGEAAQQTADAAQDTADAISGERP